MATFNVSEFEQLIVDARANYFDVINLLNNTASVCNNSGTLFSSEDSSLASGYYEVSGAVRKCGSKFEQAMSELFQLLDEYKTKTLENETMTAAETAMVHDSILNSISALDSLD